MWCQYNRLKGVHVSNNTIMKLLLDQVSSLWRCPYIERESSTILGPAGIQTHLRPPEYWSEAHTAA